MEAGRTPHRLRFLKLLVCALSLLHAFLYYRHRRFFCCVFHFAFGLMVFSLGLLWFLCKSFARRHFLHDEVSEIARFVALDFLSASPDALGDFDVHVKVRAVHADRKVFRVWLGIFLLIASD